MNTYKLLRTGKKNGTSYTQKKLKKKSQYKYIVRAYKLADGKKITILGHIEIENLYVLFYATKGKHYFHCLYSAADCNPYPSF